MKKVLKRILKILGWTLGVLIVLFIAVGLLLRSPKVQTWIAQKVTNTLSKNWNTTVSIDRVKFKFFTSFEFQNFYIEDYHNDTMIYAGSAEATFSIFKPLKKEIGITKLALTDGQVYFNKQADEERFNFEQVFSPPDSTGAGEEELQDEQDGKPKKPFKLSIGRIDLENIEFQMNDRAVGTFFSADLPLGRIDIDELDFNNGLIDLESVILNDPDVVIRNTIQPDMNAEIISESAIPAPNENENAEAVVDTPTILKGLRIEYNRFVLTNGQFNMENTWAEREDYGMDFNHLDVSNINLEVADGWLEGDTIYSDIVNMTAKEKGGLEIQALEGINIVSNKGISLTNMYLQTSESRLRGNLLMKHDDFGDFENFEEEVRIEAELENSQLALTDIDQIVKTLGPVKDNLVEIDGSIKGNISNIRGRDLSLKIGNQTTFAGDLGLRGLPNIEETFINLRVDKLQSSATDLRRIYPGLQLPKELEALGLFTFEGNFDGFINDFVTDGTLTSSIGTLTADANIKLNTASGIPQYSGSVQANSFDLGALLNEAKLLGPVSLTAEIDGKGFKVNDIDASLNGQITQVRLNGYTYSDIQVNGTFRESFFDGTIDIEDPNANLAFTGKIDITDKDLPKFEATADLQNVHLKELNLVKDSIIADAKIKLDFEGKSIDQLVGFIEMYDIAVIRNSTLYQMDSVQLNVVRQEGGEKALQLRSDYLTADVTGNYDFSQLPLAFTKYLANYTDITLDSTQQLASPQSFTYSVTVKRTTDFLSLINPNLTYISKSTLNGSFDSETQDFVMEGTIPRVVYGNYRIDDFIIDANSDADVLNITSIIGEVYMKDSLFARTTTITTDIHRDDIDFSLRIEGDSAVNSLYLTGTAQTDSDTLIVSLNPSEIYLNGDLWQFAENNQIKYKNKYLQSRDLVLSNGNRSLEIKAEHQQDSIVDLSVIFDNVQIGDFTEFFMPGSVVISGLANGEVAVKDLFYEQGIVADIEVEQLAVNDDELGDLNVNSDVDLNTQKINLNASLQGAGNDLQATGTYSIDPDNAALDIDVEIEKLSLAPLEALAQGNIRNIGGYLKGNLKVDGTADKPNLTGNLRTLNVEMTIDYFGTHYKLPDEDIVFEKNRIDLGNLTVVDINNQKATVSGSISHNYLADMQFDVEIDANDFQFLNTDSRKASNGFYGETYATGYVRISGGLDALDVYVNARPRPNPRDNSKSEISIPMLSGAETGQYDFFQFINKDSTADEQLRFKESTISVTLDLNLNTNAIINIVLDPTTNDKMTATGSGSVKLQVTERGEFFIYGLYEIAEGKYTFNLVSITKEFELTGKSNQILFLKDVETAIIDLQAKYTTKAQPYNLIADIISENNQLKRARAKQSSEVELIMNLTGYLNSPKIGFDIRMPDVDPLISGDVQTKITLLKANENELNKQVFGVLVLNSFLPSTAGGLSSTSSPITAGTAVNTVSEFFLGQIERYANDLFNELVYGLNINVGLENYSIEGDNEDQAGATRTNFELGLSQRLLDDRITFYVGGNVDFGQEYANNEANSTFLAQDIRFEYTLTEDGRISIIAYNRGDFDVLTNTQTNKTGVGISFTEEFENAAELFGKNKDKKQKYNTQKQPTTPDGTKPEDITTE